jgi:hypothetical protein
MACRAFTAFITFAGVYQFTRQPFGPKRATSYFQEQMATVVLAGMIDIICEMYLDDCIAYGSVTDEFCERLEKLFIRFDEEHIFLKAIKCKFGMSEVEYVGKIVSKDGLRMSDKQIMSPDMQGPHICVAGSLSSGRTSLLRKVPDLVALIILRPVGIPALLGTSLLWYSS